MLANESKGDHGEPDLLKNMIIDTLKSKIVDK